MSMIPSPPPISAEAIGLALAGRPAADVAASLHSEVEVLSGQIARAAAPRTDASRPVWPQIAGAARRKASLAALLAWVEATRDTRRSSPPPDLDGEAIEGAAAEAVAEAYLSHFGADALSEALARIGSARAVASERLGRLEAEGLRKFGGPHERIFGAIEKDLGRAAGYVVEREALKALLATLDGAEGRARSAVGEAVARALAAHGGREATIRDLSEVVLAGGPPDATLKALGSDLGEVVARLHQLGPGASGLLAASLNGQREDLGRQAEQRRAAIADAARAEAADAVSRAEAGDVSAIGRIAGLIRPVSPALAEDLAGAPAEGVAAIGAALVAALAPPPAR